MYIFIKQNKCGPFSQELVLVNVEQPHAVELRQLGKRDDHQGYKVWDKVFRVVSGVQTGK